MSIFKKIIILILVIIISGLSAVLTEHLLFPHLASTRLFQKYGFLKKTAENITLINKTEQVFVKEESSVLKLANSSISSVVEVVSYSDQQTKEVNFLKDKYGAGLIVTSDGLIMTCASAINLSHSKYKVLTYDGGVYEAELKGVDSWSNLVFLKISAANLSAVSFGNSAETKPGEKVLAIGRSSSKSRLSFSSGILSDFNPTLNLAGKTLSSSEKMEGVFRVDMALGENFLGGPLVDYSGQVIGIIGSFQFDGETFFYEIPTEKVKLVIDRFISGEIEKNPFLGIYYIPLTKENAISHNFEIENGAFVFSPSGQQGLAVISGSPAEKAGIRLGDIIIGVDGEAVDLDNSFSNLVFQRKKGEKIKLLLIRNAQEMEQEVQL